MQFFSHTHIDDQSASQKESTQFVTFTLFSHAVQLQTVAAHARPPAPSALRTTRYACCAAGTTSASMRSLASYGTPSCRATPSDGGSR